MSEVVLREATIDDLATSLAIIHAAFEEYRGKLDPPSGVHHQTLDDLRKHLEKGHILLAYRGDEAVGTVLYYIDNDYVYFGRLSVLPAYRRQGIAQRMIEYIEQWTRQQGLSRVVLGVRIVLASNREFYERLGYRVFESRTHEGYTEPTYLIMEKFL